MEARLNPPPGEPTWPPGISLGQWRNDAAPDIHQLLVDCYKRGGGEVTQDFHQWFASFSTDSEFDPSSCFLLWDGFNLAAVILCWSTAFVKDLCVAEAHRRRGLGEALLQTAMSHFARRGAPTLALKVDADNPSGALRLYQRCGFEVVERLLIER